MQELKTAVIGVGRLGTSHARWYSRIAGSKLVGVYDTDHSRAKTVADELKCMVFASLQEALSAVDAVSVVTPTTTHYAVAKVCISAGVHTLIEKPISGSVDEARELESLARDKKVTLTVGHIERFNPAFRAMQKIKMNPRFIEAHRLAAFNPRGSDVAVILDLMVHDIDLALKLIDSKPSRISASAIPVITDRADIANVRIEFENGAVANLTASRISLQPMRKMRIFQQSGYYALDFIAKRADIYQLGEKGAGAESEKDAMRFPLGESGKEIVYTSASAHSDDDQLKAELEAFFSAVRGDRQVAVTASEATTALQVALEVEQIAQQGRILAQA